MNPELLRKAVIRLFDVDENPLTFIAAIVAAIFLLLLVFVSIIVLFGPGGIFVLIVSITTLCLVHVMRRVRAHYRALEDGEDR